MLAIFLDIETTGLDFFAHRAIDFAFKIIDISTGKEMYCFQTVVKQPVEVWESRDLQSIKINGFDWEKIQTGITEAELKNQIISIFSKLHISRERAFYICQNPAFDRGFFSQIVNIYTQETLHWPYRWLDFASMFWALQVKNAKQQRLSLPIEINLSKNAIAEHYHLPLESMPHSALNGVNHLILCYQTAIGFGDLTFAIPQPLTKYDE